MYRLIGAIVLVCSLVLGWLWMDFQSAVDQPLELSQPVVFEVAKGEHLTQVTERLSEIGLVKRPVWFSVQAFADGSGKRIKFGEYEVRSGATFKSILAMLAAGKVRQHPVTLVEGWTFAQWADLLRRSPILAQTLGEKSPDQIMALLDAADRPAEGWFFPDTYFVTKGTSDLDVLKRALRKMRVALDEEWVGRAESLPFAKPEDALVLASLVEKETARAEERPLIAGVFVRRLQKGMRLQTDPTVIYGMGKNYQGDIRREDLRRDTPYNTYTRAGLPPTPIAMPSLASIRAALHPAPGDSLYFVAKGDGTHAFSATLADHQQAVNRYQRHLQRAPDSPNP